MNRFQGKYIAKCNINYKTKYYFLLKNKFMDKSLILNEIKKHLGFKKDVDFAEFLGINQSTLSAWHKRGSINFELIIAKCKDIDANWLLSGKGQILKENKKDSLNKNKSTFNEDLKSNIGLLNKEIVNISTILESKQETIETQKELISNLKSENQRLKSELETLKEKKTN